MLAGIPSLLQVVTDTSVTAVNFFFEISLKDITCDCDIVTNVFFQRLGVGTTFVTFELTVSSYELHVS